MIAYHICNNTGELGVGSWELRFGIWQLAVGSWQLRVEIWAGVVKVERGGKNEHCWLITP